MNLCHIFCSEILNQAPCAGVECFLWCSLFSFYTMYVCVSLNFSPHLILLNYLLLLHSSYCLLWNLFMKSIYVLHIFGIYLAYLCHIFCISIAYFLHIFSIYLIYLWIIIGISLGYLRHMFCISLTHIWYIFSICSA